MITLVKKTVSAAIIFIAITMTNAFGQCKEWNWPEDKTKAEEQITLLQDEMNGKKYKAAIKPLNWLIANTPQLNSSIYIHGANLYDALASREKDPALKKKYADSLLIIYDLRIEYCDEKASILNRKALSACKYFINTDEAERVLPLMDSAFAVNGNDISDGTLLPYMQTTAIIKSKFKTLTEDDVLSRYEKLVKITDYKIAQAKGNAKELGRLQKTKKDIDIWLFKVVKPDCDFVRNNLGPKFKEDPENITIAKRIFAFMLQGKCTDDPLWLEAGEAIFAKEKDFGLGKNLALRFLALQNYEKSDAYFTSTLPLAPTRADSSEMFYYKGTIETKKQNKVKAREYFLTSVKLDGTRKEAYERIGDLYYGSFDECAAKQNQADDRAVYLAAYDYYAKAGNQKKMALAKQAFPSKEDIFLVNYKVGDKLKVNCWIGEEVVIKTRN